MNLPKMVWMEVDLINKELPVKIADSSQELALLCGVKETTVLSSASRARRGAKVRYIGVWIDGI